MRDLHLFGMPRSGTSFAYEYFKLLLKYNNVDFAGLFEPLNPWLRHKRLHDGLTSVGFVSSLDDTDGEALMAVYDSYSNHARFIKHIFLPVSTPFFDRKLGGTGFRWIEITRDRLECYLSWVIAHHGGLWVTRDYDVIAHVKQKLSPFEAPLSLTLEYKQRLKQYDSYRDRLIRDGQLIGVLEYDDLIRQCQSMAVAVLSHFAAAQDVKLLPASQAADLLPKKILSLHEKKMVVRNWQEVAKILECDDHG